MNTSELPPIVLEDLARSGLTAATARRLRLQYVTIKNAKNDGSVIRGYRIPYWNMQRKIIENFSRTRWLDPYRVKGEKQDRKYMQTPDTPPHLFLDPIYSWDKIAQDTSVPLWTPEGEKKSSTMCEHKYHAIGLGGVWSFLTRNRDGEESYPIEELSLINFQGREVFIVFDSDAAYKPQVLRAQDAWRREIIRRGGNPFEVILPTLPGQTKTGIDDFIVHHGGAAREEIAKLPCRSLYIGKYVAGATLMSTKITKPKFIVEELVAPGLTLLVGPSKRGKSWWALMLANAVSRGDKKFLEAFNVPGPVDVALLALEDPLYRLQERQKILRTAGLGAPSDRLKIYSSGQWPTQGEEGITALHHMLRYIHPGVKLVIVDTLKHIYPVSEKGKNAYHQDYEVMLMLKRIADERSVAIIAVHHDNKGVYADLSDSISGSRGISGGCDNWLFIKRKTNEPLGTLNTGGRDIQEVSIAMEFAAGVWTFRGPAGEVLRTDAQRALLEALGADTLSSAEIAARVGKSRQTAFQTLTIMERDGLVSVVKGKYTATAPVGGKSKGGTKIAN